MQGFESYMADGIALLFLVVASVQDLRTRTIPRGTLIFGAVGTLGILVYRAFCGSLAVPGDLLAALPGVLLLALSWMTEEQIGYGDGICVMIVGLLIGTPMIYLVLMASLLLSSVWAVGLLASRRGTRRSRMPWVPFLAAGLVLAWMIRGGVA